jgi:phage baseplate assembly protein W
MIGYSPKFPLQFDSEVGAYALNKKLGDVAKQNFKNLLLTVPGERIMDIEFGVGLRSYLFEPNGPSVKTRIVEAVEAQVSTYLPYIQLASINFSSIGPDGLESQMILGIEVSFSVPSLGVDGKVMVDDPTVGI